MRSGFEFLAALLAAAVGFGGSVARADSGGADPSYGRVDGDVTVVVGAGGVVAPRGPRAEAEVRLRYLETAGVFATYEDGALVGSSAEPVRIAAIGLELRPFFLFRWLKGYEMQRARWDLTLDSIGLELGATLQAPSGSNVAVQSGLEVGLGVELPIFEGASGPWVGLRGALRWNDRALAAWVVDSADDRQAVLALTLAWHQLVATHVVDAGDEAPR